MRNIQYNDRHDVFRAFLVENAEYGGYYEMPCIKTSNKIPNKVILFSKAMESKTKDFDQWVMFYEHDYKFECLWKNPKKYLERLKKFNGIISPDFSMYRNMPLAMQIWNTYRNRALAIWFQSNGIEVIPNVRWNDERTYTFAFDGIEKEKTIAIGTHGCLRGKENREYLEKGLDVAVQQLNPRRIIVYGSALGRIFDRYRDRGIEIIVFESEILTIRKQVKA